MTFQKHSGIFRLLMILLILISSAGCYTQDAATQVVTTADYDPSCVKGFDYELSSELVYPGIAFIAYDNELFYLGSNNDINICHDDFKVVNDIETDGIISDISVVQGKIYAARQSDDGTIMIDVYDSSTLNLEKSYSTEATQCYGLTAETDNSLIWFYDENGLAYYDLAKGSYRGHLSINDPLEKISGLAYYDGYLYMSNENNIYRVQADISAPESNLILEYESETKISGVSFIPENKQMIIAQNDNITFLNMNRLNNPTDYNFERYWLIQAADHDTDVFVILPEISFSRKTADNEDVNNLQTVRSFRKILNSQALIYQDACNIYAPIYRQPTAGVYLDEEGLIMKEYPSGLKNQFLDMAYEDVRNAFSIYREKYNQGRPFIIFASSAGAQLAVRLVAEFGKDPDFDKQHIATYAIGTSITQYDLAAHLQLKMAQAQDDTGVIISFSAYSEDCQTDDTISLAINPLSWNTDNTSASASSNLGYVMSDAEGNIIEEIPEFCAAAIDETSGRLIITDISKPESLASPQLINFHEGDYHLYNLNLFFRNLQENILARIAAFRQ